jgi:hypothetical protein
MMAIFPFRPVKIFSSILISAIFKLTSSEVETTLKLLQKTWATDRPFPLWLDSVLTLMVQDSAIQPFTDSKNNA